MGGGLGLLGAFAATGLLGNMAPGADRLQLVVILGVALGTLAVASLASWLPARRATRIEPVGALRSL